MLTYYDISATQQGLLHLLDLRAKNEASAIQVDPERGVPGMLTYADVC
jgi:hypothetical protein